jgi:hypothetical protein
MDDHERLARSQSDSCGHDVYCWCSPAMPGYISIICMNCVLGSIGIMKSLDEIQNDLAELAQLKKKVVDLEEENLELRALPDAPDYLAAKKHFADLSEMKDANIET